LGVLPNLSTYLSSIDSGNYKRYSVLIQTCVMRDPQAIVANVFRNENCCGSYL